MKMVTAILLILVSMILLSSVVSSKRIGGLNFEINDGDVLNVSKGKFSFEIKPRFVHTSGIYNLTQARLLAPHSKFGLLTEYNEDGLKFAPFVHNISPSIQGKWNLTLEVQNANGFKFSDLTETQDSIVFPNGKVLNFSDLISNFKVTKETNKRIKISQKGGGSLTCENCTFDPVITENGPTATHKGSAINDTYFVLGTCDHQADDYTMYIYNANGTLHYSEVIEDFSGNNCAQTDLSVNALNNTVVEFSYANISSGYVTKIINWEAEQEICTVTYGSSSGNRPINSMSMNNTHFAVAHLDDVGTVERYQLDIIDNNCNILASKNLTGDIGTDLTVSVSSMNSTNVVVGMSTIGNVTGGASEVKYDSYKFEEGILKSITGTTSLFSELDVSNTAFWHDMMPFNSTDLISIATDSDDNRIAIIHFSYDGTIYSSMNVSLSFSDGFPEGAIAIINSTHYIWMFEQDGDSNKMYGNDIYNNTFLPFKTIVSASAGPSEIFSRTNNRELCDGNFVYLEETSFTRDSWHSNRSDRFPDINGWNGKCYGENYEFTSHGMEFLMDDVSIQDSGDDQGTCSTGDFNVNEEYFMRLNFEEPTLKYGCESINHAQIAYRPPFNLLDAGESMKTCVREIDNDFTVNGEHWVEGDACTTSGGCSGAELCRDDEPTTGQFNDTTESCITFDGDGGTPLAQVYYFNVTSIFDNAKNNDYNNITFSLNHTIISGSPSLSDEVIIFTHTAITDDRFKFILECSTIPEPVSEPEPDTCSPDNPLTTDHTFECDDNCVIGSDLDVDGNTIIISGSGSFVANANIFDALEVRIQDTCDVRCEGGCFI